MKTEWLLDEHDVFEAVIDYICRKYKVEHIEGLEIDWIDETDAIMDRDLGIRMYGDVTYNLKEK